jgi:hypothetical protein
MGTQVGPPHQVQQHELQALNPLLELGQTFRKYGNRGGSHLGRRDILARLRSAVANQMGKQSLKNLAA